MSNKLNILVVDSVPEHLKQVESILSVLDIDLILATSAKEALGLIKNKEIIIALFDIHLPVMNGIELAKIIQHDKNRAKVPIIFITGQVKDDLELEECYKSGAVDFILKPFRDNILLSKVKIFLKLHNQEMQIREDHFRLGLNISELYRC